jgi:hypothetical protein
MRVSCVFVSVAVMLAQQASAAPVIGLPALPLLDGNGRLVDGLTNTLGPIPIIGPLLSDLLESKSRGGLLSTLDVTGKNGLINDHGLSSDLGRSILDRRGEIPIAGPLLAQIPGADQIQSMLPIDSFSGLNDLIESIPGISTVESLEGAIQLPSLSKRDAGVQALVSSILGQVAGGKQFESMIPFDAIPKSLPSMSQIQSVIPQVQAMIPQAEAMFPQVEAMLPQVEAMLPQAMAMFPQVEGMMKSVIPNLTKRDGQLQTLVSSFLDQVPGGKEIESMIPFDALPESLPSISQIQGVIPQVQALIPQAEAMLPQVQAMIPQVMTLVPQVEGMVKSVIPNLTKRDGQLQALVSSILGQVSGGKQLESMIPFEALPKSLPSINQVKSVIPQVEAMIPQIKAMIPQVEAMIPQVVAMVPQVEAIAKSIASLN